MKVEFHSAGKRLIASGKLHCRNDGSDKIVLHPNNGDLKVILIICFVEIENENRGVSVSHVDGNHHIGKLSFNKFRGATGSTVHDVGILLFDDGRLITADFHISAMSGGAGEMWQVDISVFEELGGEDRK